MYGNTLGYPVMTLNGGEQFELNFDDFDADVKNYYYTFQLCNADWTPSSLFSFNYIKGFQNNRISTYRRSSVAFTNYTHYQATLPDRNCMPSLSGNYLLKVFLNGDTSKLAFTKRFLVVENKCAIASRIQQPFNAAWFRTHQKIQLSLTLNNNINSLSQQDIKVVVVQNYSWPAAIYLNRPNIYRGNYFEWNDESQLVFPAGKEWRWIDLRSLRLMSDRMRKLDKTGARVDVFIKPDGDRQQQPYIYYKDLDGLFSIENSDGFNPYWQSDYANVHFTFVPPGNVPFPGKDIYVYGELTNYLPDTTAKMQFNEAKGVYEKTLILKQGFYNYSYITVPANNQSSKNISFENTEGNYWVTENAYMVLVYYRAFGSRSDELIGYATLNSLLQ